MGFSEGFISMIKLLYAHPSALVIRGNTCSSRFSVSRSSCQGCPLSPFLFSLSLETIAQAIQQVHEPIIIHNTLHHISLDADNILIFTKNHSHMSFSLVFMYSAYSCTSLLVQNLYIQYILYMLCTLDYLCGYHHG